MASYKFKVIKGGKVIGEATTRAEAEAAAKKLGGHVAEVVAGTSSPAGRRGNPGNRSDELPENRVTLTLADGTKVTRTEYGKESDIRAFSMASSLGPLGEVYRKGDPRGSDVLFVDIMQTRAPITKPNPPLEPHSATTLLDAVKPHAVQQIHGVKVARVGAGYSVDGKAMTRAQVLKALEAGRASNPKQNAYSGGSTMSADDYVRFCHAYAISRVLEGASKDLALLAVRQLGTLAQNGDPIRIDRTIRDAWASAKLPGKPTEKALHDGATAFVSSAADRETNPKGKPTTAKASGRKSGLLPHAAPYAGKEQIEYYNEQADIAEAAGDVESQRTALRNMIAAAKKFGATLDAQIAQSLLDDTYKSHSPKANPKTAKASGRKIQYV